MIYSDACEAQGMTLADLLKKQAPVRVNYSISEITEGEQLHVSSDGIFTVTNDMPSEITVTYSTFHTGITSGETLTINVQRVIDTYPTATVKFGGDDFYVVAGTFVQDRSYYDSFGLSHVVLPASADTYLPAIWDRVCTRVNERYWKRYLACETLEEWQVLLQTMTDELAPRYERAFRMYAANSEASEADILATMRTDYGDGLTDEHTQTAKGTSKTTVRDTPDGVINDTSNYAGTVTEGSTDAGTTKSTRKGTVTVTQTGSDGVLGRVNENLRLWRDLETDLVKEYANAFMVFIWA